MYHIILLKSKRVLIAVITTVFCSFQRKKKLIYDFRKCDPSYIAVIISDNPVEHVQSFNTWPPSLMTDYLGLILRLLKNFNIDNTILNLVYTSVVKSIVLFDFLTCWSNVNNRQKEYKRRQQRRVERGTGNSITTVEN